MTGRIDNASKRYHHGNLRSALLKAAEAELSAKGIEGFTLRACAKRAGVSHAAPAHHFGDARGLLAALAAEGFERFKTTMERRVAALGETATARQRLTAAGLGYLEFSRTNPALFRLMFSSNKPDYNHPELDRAASAAFAHLVSGIEAAEGINPQVSREGQRRLAAIWSTVHGLSDLMLGGHLTFLTGQSEADMERDLAAILEMTFRPAE